MANTKDYIKYIKSKHCIICGSSPVDPDQNNQQKIIVVYLCAEYTTQKDII